MACVRVGSKWTWLCQAVCHFLTKSLTAMPCPLVRDFFLQLPFDFQSTCHTPPRYGCIGANTNTWHCPCPEACRGTHDHDMLAWGCKYLSSLAVSVSIGMKPPSFLSSLDQANRPFSIDPQICCLNCTCTCLAVLTSL